MDEEDAPSSPATAAYNNNQVAVTQKPSNDAAHSQSLLLYGLPPEVLEQVLAKLNSKTLATVNRTCKLLRAVDRTTGLRLADKVAREQLVRKLGPSAAQRWRAYSWLERLQIEETCTSFDRARCEKAGFCFGTDDNGRVVSVKLEGIGPKLLISDVTNHDVPLLRWRMELKGNNAVELGVVPVELQEKAKALHKCERVPDNNEATDNRGRRPSGFCSAITVGSLLPVKLPLMRNSVVEIVVRRDKFEYIVTNPRDGMEMIWRNTVTIPQPYTGPLEFRFEQDISPHFPVKLAVTCWARAAFDVLHNPELAPAPPTKLEASSSDILNQEPQHAPPQPAGAAPPGHELNA